MKIDPLVTHNLQQHSSCLNPSSVLAFTITTSQIIAFYFNKKKIMENPIETWSILES